MLDLLEVSCPMGSHAGIGADFCSKNHIESPSHRAGLFVLAIGLGLAIIAFGFEAALDGGARRDIRLKKKEEGRARVAEMRRGEAKLPDNL